MMGIILFGAFAILLFLGLPIGFALGVASLSGVALMKYPIIVIGQRMFTAVDSFPLMAIPLFMLAGAIMTHGGIKKRIIDIIAYCIIC